MDIKKIATWLVIIGGLVHGLIGIGQAGIVAMIPVLNIIQIVVGVAAVYLLAKEFKVM
jgi:uncharacterized membrane protein YuzA (DUF378 family)